MIIKNNNYNNKVIFKAIMKIKIFLRMMLCIISFFNKIKICLSQDNNKFSSKIIKLKTLIRKINYNNKIFNNKINKFIIMILYR